MWWWWYGEESVEVWPWTLIPRRKNPVDGCRGSHHGSVFIRRLELSPAETVLLGGRSQAPSSALPAGNPILRFRATDPKPELA